MDRSLLDQLLGLGEAGLTLGTGAVAGAVGMPYGLFRGITGGNYGTREGVQQAQREAEAFMRRNTYMPRTESGQGLLQSLGKAMEASKLPPVIPEAAMLASIPRAAAAAQTERLGMAAEKALEAPLQRAYDKGGLSREMLLAMGQNTVSPATVFHGSPHRFTKFDSSKIGTGEGAQAYGHGLYLAEAPGVATEYAKILQKPTNSLFAEESLEKNNPQLLQKLREATGNDKYSSNAGKAYMRPNDFNLSPELKKEVLAFKKSSSNLYQVDLPDEQIAKMLDYDKPLSKQPEYIKQQLLDLIEYEGLPEYLRKDIVEDRGLNTGQRVYEELVKTLGSDKAASEALRQASIPGIRYLDQGSRGTGKGTSNFVVFPGMEDMLRIEQINEQPINSLLQTLGR
jgi:hypothetical protein